MNETQEKPVSLNGNSLAPRPAEMRLQQLKAAVYDTQRQIQYLTQVQLPGLEHEIDELTQQLMNVSGKGGGPAPS